MLVNSNAGFHARMHALLLQISRSIVIARSVIYSRLQRNKLNTEVVCVNMKSFPIRLLHKLME